MRRLLAAACAGLALSAAAAPDRETRLVYLRDVDPSIAQDMRYAGAHNFTGHPVPGYDAPECMLLPEVAQALATVQKDLRSQGFGLKTFDCYRPRRAVLAFIAWAASNDGDNSTKIFYPGLERSRLIPLGYIAAHSNHSLGIAIDLTIVRLAKAPGRPPALNHSCTWTEMDSATETVDMGTTFDCFDPKSWSDSASVTPDQHRNRMILAAAMERHGFRRYEREWWHFTFRADADEAFDAPIVARRARP